MADQTDLTDEPMDELLARSAPPVSTASPRIQHEVRMLVRATAETPTLRTRRGRTGQRLAVGAGAAAIAFAGISAAAASPSAPAWIAWADWTPDATVADTPGECALLGIKVVPAGGASPDDPAVVVARQYLAGLNLHDIDYSDELVEQGRTLVTAEDGVTQGTASEMRTNEQREYHAYTSAISQMVFDEVERQGLELEDFSIEGRGACDPDSRR